MPAEAYTCEVCGHTFTDEDVVDYNCEKCKTWWSMDKGEWKNMDDNPEPRCSSHDRNCDEVLDRIRGK